MTLNGTGDFNNQYYLYNRRLLKIVGLWPYEESSKRLFNAWFVGLTIFLTFTFQTYVLLTSQLKMDSIVESMQFYLPSVCFLCGFYNQQCNFTILQTISKRIQNDWAMIANERELIAMQKYLYQSRFYSSVIACTFYLYVGIAILPFILPYILYAIGKNSYPQLILPVALKFFQNDRFYHTVMLLYQCLASIIVSTVGIANYTILMSLIQHACALLNIVAIKIDQPFTEDQYYIWKKIFVSKPQEDYEWIISIIKCYNNAITFFDTVKLLYGKAYFVEVFMALLYLITDFFCMFQFLTSTIKIEQLLKTSMYVVGNFLIIYCGFYLCQKLLDHSANVYSKFRQIPFYELSIKTHKVLPLLILRSMKPMNLSYKGVFVASHEILGKLMKLSFSFATVCHNMR